MKRIIIFLTLLFYFSFAQGQENEKKESRFQLIVGGRWQSTTFRFFNFIHVPQLGKSNVHLPYKHEKNIQGNGIKLGVKYQLGKKVFLSFLPVIRYDYIHSIPQEFSQSNDWIIDLHFGIEKKINKTYFGLGYVTVNTRKKFVWATAPDYKENSYGIEFSGYTFYYGQTFWNDLNVEWTTIFIPGKLPIYRFGQYLMFNVNVYYTFKFKKQKKT